MAGCGDNTQGQASAQVQARPPQSVSVITLSPQAMTHEYVLPGRVTPSRQSQVRPQVDGVITKRLFEEGAQVEKGQQLYQIDDARYRARLNSAIADKKSAEANLKTLEAKARRYDDLVAENAVSKQEYDDVVAQKDQALAAISVAESAVELARVNLEYTKVYAPISGQISRSFVTEGALVTTNQTQQLAVITQLDPVYVDMQESGNAIMSLRQTMREQRSLPVSLTMDETSQVTYAHEGTVKFSEVTVEQTTGSVTLRAEVPNPDGDLMPGMFVKAHVKTGTEDVLMVPQRATTRQPNGALSVMIVNSDNKVEQRILKTAEIYEDQYVVEGGLKAGDKVIVTGYQKVQPGASVTPQPWSKRSSAANQQG
ncbi:efflux RND transporter periplasmic adaptor subunit [Alteromonas halophila]